MKGLRMWLSLQYWLEKLSNTVGFISFEQRIRIIIQSLVTRVDMPLNILRILHLFIAEPF